MPGNPHDLLFKSVFSQPDQAAAHLASVLPPEIGRHLRFSSLQRVPGSFVDESLSERHADLLFHVERHDGGEALVYVLFEHQSTPDPLMPFRLLAYMVRIWRHWLEGHPSARTLPLVVPVVLYHGRARWSVAPSLSGMLDLPAGTADELGPHLPELSYVLEDLSAVAEAELRGRALGRMALLLLKHAADGDLWTRLPAWGAVLAEVGSESGLRAVELVMRYITEVQRWSRPLIR